MKIRIIALVFIFALMLSGCSRGGEILVQRESPVKEVTAEEFEKEYGFGLSVPAGAECVIYEIDTESHRGTMSFKLNGAIWSARALKTDVFKDIVSFGVDDITVETVGVLDSDQIMRVRGVEPDAKFYRTNYTDGSKAYKSTAMWFLEDKGMVITLESFSEKPVYKMPVEVFDSI